MKLAKPYLEHILQECEFLMEKSKGIIFEDFKDQIERIMKKEGWQL